MLLGFGSDQETLDSLRVAARVESSQAFYPLSVAAEASGQDTAVSGSAQATTSSTNIQVSGVDESGLTEVSRALLPTGSRFHDNARTVLSSNGDAWFYDHGELYYTDAVSPTVLLPSQ